MWLALIPDPFFIWWYNNFVLSLSIMTDKLKHKIINYLNKEYSGLVRYETDKYPDYIFFMKDGEVIFEYSVKNKRADISHVKIWSFLRSFFALNDTEIQNLTKTWVEKHFNFEVRMTLIFLKYRLRTVEEHYKLDNLAHS
jgi:hypothetical protein